MKTDKLPVYKDELRTVWNYLVNLGIKHRDGEIVSQDETDGAAEMVRSFAEVERQLKHEIDCNKIEGLRDQQERYLESLIKEIENRVVWYGNSPKPTLEQITTGGLSRKFYYQTLVPDFFLKTQPLSIDRIVYGFYWHLHAFKDQLNTLGKVASATPTRTQKTSEIPPLESIFRDRVYYDLCEELLDEHNIRGLPPNSKCAYKLFAIIHGFKWFFNDEYSNKSYRDLLIIFNNHLGQTWSRVKTSNNGRYKSFLDKEVRPRLATLK